MKISKTAFNASLFSLFSFFNQGISFLLLIILANYIMPGEYGKLSLFNTIVTFLGYFIAMSTTGYESISFFKKTFDEFRSDFTAIHVIATAVFLVLLLVLIFLGNQICVLLSISLSFLYIALLISYLSVFLTMSLSYYRVKQEVYKYGMMSCGNAIINFVLTLFLVISLSYGWQGRVYSHLYTNIAITIAALLIYQRNNLLNFKRLSKSQIFDILSWGIPLIPHMGAIWIRQGLDRYIINSFHSTSEVGLFSFALNLVNIIIIIGSSFNNVLSVEIYQTLSSNLNSTEKKHSLVKKSKKIALIFAGASLLVVLGCSILVPMLLPAYKEAIPYFYVLSIYGFVQCLYFLVVNYLFYYKRNKEIMYTTFGTSILHLLLSLIFTRYSLSYTCLIYVIIQIVIVSIIFIRSKKILDLELRKNKDYENKK